MRGQLQDHHVPVPGHGAHLRGEDPLDQPAGCDQDAVHVDGFLGEQAEPGQVGHHLGEARPTQRLLNTVDAAQSRVFAEPGRHAVVVGLQPADALDLALLEPGEPRVGDHPAPAQGERLTLADGQVVAVVAAEEAGVLERFPGCARDSPAGDVEAVDAVEASGEVHGEQLGQTGLQTEGQDRGAAARPDVGVQLVEPVGGRPGDGGDRDPGPHRRADGGLGGVPRHGHRDGVPVDEGVVERGGDPDARGGAGPEPGPQLRGERRVAVEKDEVAGVRVGGQGVRRGAAHLPAAEYGRLHKRVPRGVLPLVIRRARRRVPPGP